MAADEKCRAEIAALRELFDAERRHQRALREADQRAVELLQTFNASHFAQLNENAARTIEERGHFLSVEAFNPFKDMVLTALNREQGRSQGTAAIVGYIIGAAGAVSGILGLVAYLHK